VKTRARGLYTESATRGLIYVPAGSVVCSYCCGDGWQCADESHGERWAECEGCGGSGHVAKEDDQTEAELLASIDLVSVRKRMQKRSA
jgi:hypothetical protein